MFSPDPCELMEIVMSLWKILGVLTLNRQDTSRHFEGSFRSIRAIQPCEASEQKLGQKPDSELRVIELRYCHHSICLQKQVYRKKMSKLDEKLPSYAQFNVLVPKCYLAYFVPIDGHFGQFVRYELQICFSNHLH